jgi:hypothetical protein
MKGVEARLRDSRPAEALRKAQNQERQEIVCAGRQGDGEEQQKGDRQCKKLAHDLNPPILWQGEPGLSAAILRGTLPPGREWRFGPSPRE